MNSTPASLLDRLKSAPPDAPDWRRLHDIYEPLIRRWLGQIPGLREETPDLVQDVLLVLVQQLPHFDRQREGSFRCWLRSVTVNRVRAYWKQRDRRRRAGQGEETHDMFLAELEDPVSALSRQWDDEHDRFVLDRLLTIVQRDFTSSTWEAFQRFALKDAPARQVAQEMGTTENAILLAKSRVLKRLREEAAGLVD